MEFVPRIITPGEGHFFLLGPRGTGKTLWTTRHYPGALRIDLLDPETLRLLSARPERLIEVVEASPRDRGVIIDEIQKLPPYGGALARPRSARRAHYLPAT